MRYKPAMIAVSSPNQPGKGTVRCSVAACFQSTVPAMTGANADTNASAAEAVAIGIASRPAHFTPHRLTSVKAATIAQASAETGTFGRYHSWIAAAEKIAVSPQVGTQPHQ